MLSLITTALFIIGAINALLGVLVLIRDPRLIQNRLFFLFSVAVGGWVIGIAGFLLAHDTNIAYIWAKVYYAFPLFIAAAMPLFAHTFPVHERIPKKLWAGVLIGLLVLELPLIFDRTFLTQSLVYHDWGKEIVINHTHYIFYSMYLLFFFAVGMIHLYVKSNRLNRLERAQARAFLGGFVIASTLGIIFDLILPWFGNYRLIWLGPLFTNALIVATGYAIIRHKLFDVRFYVFRAAAYVLTLLVLSFLYVGPVVFFLIKVLGFPFVPLKFAIALLFASIAAFYYQSLRRRFDKFTGKIFFRDDYDSEVFTAELNESVVSNLNITSMLAQAAEIIMRTFKAEYCFFTIEDTKLGTMRTFGKIPANTKPKDIIAIHKQLDHASDKVVLTDYLTESQSALKSALRSHDIALVGRLDSDGHDNGSLRTYMMLSPKKSGILYNARDVLVLGGVINGLIVALQNALHFEEIQKFNVTLQQRIEEATRQLRRTNSKLKALDETKDDFISMASHQLRTPLTSVKGYLSMVLEGDAGSVTPLQRKMLDQAFVSSQRMVFLIADLLNVSRLKTGKFVIEPTRVNLAKLIGDEVNQLRETAKARSLELLYDKPDNFPDLMIDDTKIRQVIMNFIDNAIYYTPSSGKIRIQLIDQPGSIEFRVVDNGIGVPRQEQPHLFTKFYRAGNARQARPDGTGLGLFMAKKVIVAQGGAIIFESEEGKGSTFGFILSKHKLAAPEANTAKSPELTAVS